MRASLEDLLGQLANSNNPVTDWVLRECIIERLKRKDFL